MWQMRRIKPLRSKFACLQDLAIAKGAGLTIGSVVDRKHREKVAA
jgi:hypothetical protein